MFAAGHGRPAVRSFLPTVVSLLCLAWTLAEPSAFVQASQTTATVLADDRGHDQLEKKSSCRFAHINRTTFLIDAVFPYLHHQASLTTGDPYVLYNLEGMMKPVLEAARRTESLELLSELAAIMTKTSSGLVAVSEYHVAMGGSWVNTTFPSPVKMWLMNSTSTAIPIEVTLCSSQWIYIVSRTLRLIANVPDVNRTTAMSTFVATLSSVALKDHILRWVLGVNGSFELHGWGCANSELPMNHSRLIAGLSKRVFSPPGPAYCNAVLDQDMWVITAAMELLEASRIDPTIVEFPSAKVRQQLEDYVELGVELIESRIAPTHISGGGDTDTDTVSSSSSSWAFGAEETMGFAFDVGLMDSLPDNRYANYYGTAFPNATSSISSPQPQPQAMPPPQPVNITWDVSHGARFLSVLPAVDDYNARMSRHSVHWDEVKKGGSVSHHSSSPKLSNWTGLLANQWVYVVWNGNCTSPLFQNYYTKPDGWYRVDYNGKGDGYGVGDNGGSAAVYGGYGLLAEYAPLVSSATTCVKEVTDPDQSANPSWRDDHFFAMWWNGARRRSSWSWHSVDTQIRLLNLWSTFLECQY